MKFQNSQNFISKIKKKITKGINNRFEIAEGKKH